MNNIPKQSTIIVGFSGGPDSIYLIEHLAQNTDYNVIAAHLDHEWRSDSSQDVIWCKNYCDKKKIPFISQKISELDMPAPRTGSREGDARLYRRYFLESCAQKHPNSFIALGHHLDDQIETFFIRLARGTTAAGISCMKEQDGIYIRPILSKRKQEIVDYLEKNNINYLDDETNNDTTLLRNNIRKNIVPQLEQTDARFIKNIEKTMRELQKSYDAFQTMSAQTIQNISEENSVNIDAFLQLPETIQHEAISKLLIKNKCQVTQSNSLFKEIIRFLKEGKQKQHRLHPTCLILKTGKNFSINN